MNVLYYFEDLCKFFFVEKSPNVVNSNGKRFRIKLIWCVGPWASASLHDVLRKQRCTTRAWDAGREHQRKKVGELVRMAADGRVGLCNILSRVLSRVLAQAWNLRCPYIQNEPTCNRLQGIDCNCVYFDNSDFSVALCLHLRTIAVLASSEVDYLLAHG
eukprot:6184190-Pleurochrysis_carterae.AAC.1